MAVILCGLPPVSHFFVSSFRFSTLFSTLIVVSPNSVTVLYNLCCVSAKSFSVLLGFVIFGLFFCLLSATNELVEVEDEGNDSFSSLMNCMPRLQ